MATRPTLALPKFTVKRAERNGKKNEFEKYSVAFRGTQRMPDFTKLHCKGDMTRNEKI